jgi:hypothetical protein
MPKPALLLLVIACLLGSARPSHAVLVDFFHAGQSYSLTSATNSDTLTTEGYVFTYSLDKLFTGGTGHVIGRSSSVTWPTGLQAQAVTEGPNIGPAKFTIRRADGDVFDFMGFTAKLLANTAGAGASIEIMPLLAGEDGLPAPAAFDATGYAGSSFTYGPASTAALRGFDTYLVTLYVDFAFTNVQLNGAAVPEPSILAMLVGTLAMLGTKRFRGSR